MTRALHEAAAGPVGGGPAHSDLKRRLRERRINTSVSDAAAVLDQLTAEAQHSGNLAVEVLAMFNSAWLNGQSGSGRVAATKLEKVRQLLRSPYMPASIRDQLSARLGEPSVVAAER